MTKRRLQSSGIPAPPDPILVVGDIMCDHYVWGDVERISPEAPVQVLRWEKEANRGGGAANAAMNLAALGCRVHLVGLIGNDDPGRWLVRTLRDSRIDVSGVMVSRKRNTTLKTRVIARGQHMLRIDRETVAAPEPAEERRMVTAIKKLKRLSGVVCSDYAKGALTASILAACFSIASRPFVVVDPKGRDFSKYRGAHLLTPNEKELIDATDEDPSQASGYRPGAEEVQQRAHRLIRRVDLSALLVTRGASGMDLFEAEGGTIRRRHIDALQRHEVFDVTGAGDTVAAVLTLGAAAGLSLIDAARLANAAAGLVVGTVGTAVVDADALSHVTGRDGRSVSR